MFMFMSKGKVQLWNSQGSPTGMLLAPTRELAERMRKQSKTKLTIAEIGSVQGETVAIQLAAALRHGAEGAWIAAEDGNGKLVLNFCPAMAIHNGDCD